MLRIECIPTVGETFGRDLAGKTAIVIDALRATSVIVTALANGAAAVAAAETVAGAKQMAGEKDLLAGERQCRRIPGFHLGNSPAEFTRGTVGGRRVVMTTTNGTRGIQKAGKAAGVLAGSFLNASACARAAVMLKRDIFIVCAGTKDEFALEDGLCAGLIASAIRSAAGRDVERDDMTAAMEAAYAACGGERLANTLLASASGRRLSALGCRDDVLRCAAIDVYDAVPVLAGGELRLS